MLSKNDILEENNYIFNTFHGNSKSFILLDNLRKSAKYGISKKWIFSIKKFKNIHDIKSSLLSMYASNFLYKNLCPTCYDTSLDKYNKIIESANGVRKNSIRAIEIYVSSESNEYLDKKSNYEFLKESLMFFENIFTVKNIISSAIYEVNKHPFLTILITPITDDNKLSFSNYYDNYFYGNKYDYHWNIKNQFQKEVGIKYSFVLDDVYNRPKISDLIN